MEGFKAIPYIFLAIAVAAIIGGVSAVVQDQFGDTVDVCYNSSYVNNASTGNDHCVAVGGVGNLNWSSPDARNFSDAYTVIYNGKEATATVGAQLSTLGIIGIMVIIVGLLAGVFVYFRYFQ